MNKTDAYKDIANKLVLIKTGVLYRKGIQIDVNDTDANVGIKTQKEFDQVPDAKDRKQLYSDSITKSCVDSIPANYKMVFKVWAKQVYKPDQPQEENKEDQASKEGAEAEDGLTQTQLENVFPEFRHKLRLYGKCCNEEGKIVKNFEFYKEYKNKPHLMGKRGSKQD